MGADTRIAQSITIRADPERVFALLADPNYMPRYAARIEAAEVMEPGPDGGLVGTRLELGTTGGRSLEATVKEYEPGRLLSIQDENGLTSTWTVDREDDGAVRLTNTLTGSLDTKRANRLRYDADLKFQSIARIFEQELSTDPKESTGGHSRISGTAGTPR